MASSLGVMLLLTVMGKRLQHVNIVFSRIALVRNEKFAVLYFWLGLCVYNQSEGRFVVVCARNSRRGLIAKQVSHFTVATVACNTMR